MGKKHLVPSWTEEKIDEVKLELCRALKYELSLERRTRKECARRIGTSPAWISLIENRRIDKLTVSQLIRYLAIINPHFKILISPH